MWWEDKYESYPLSCSHSSAWWLLWVFLIPLLLFILYIARSLKNQKQRFAADCSRFPPGRRSWPVIGDSLNWYNAVASSHPPKYVEQQAKRYGKIFSCSLFGKWAVVSIDPIFNRYVMQNEGKLFQSSYPKSFRDLVGINGVITVQGDQQRKLHAVASNIMRIDKLNFHFLEDIQTIIAQTLSNFNNHQVIFLQDVCRKIAINLMVSQLLGASTESEVNEMSQLFYNFVDGCLSLPISLPGFAYHTAMKARKRIIAKIKQKIEMHKLGLAENESGKEKGVLGGLLEEEKLEDEAIADFILNLLFAGNETTAKTMLFAVYFLSQSPQAMKQLLDEQGCYNRYGDNKITWQDYKTMSFTHCVIDETLRLGGIAIWLMRETKQDVKYLDYVIPKGCFVVPFLSAVHLDENIYKGALNFNPWRWMEPENQGRRNGRSSPFFTPFGGGARFCPGAELARLQIALFLHYFVTKYTWDQLKQDKMSFFPSARLVNGFQIRLKRHNNNPK